MLEAALDLIGESGAAGVTMRGICGRAGLTARYFSENFGTRDELLDLLCRQVCAEFLDAVAGAETASPYSERRLTMLLIRDRFCADIRDPVRRDLAAVTMAGACAGLFSVWSNGTLRAPREQVAECLAETLTAYRRTLCVD